MSERAKSDVGELDDATRNAMTAPDRSSPSKRAADGAAADRAVRAMTSTAAHTTAVGFRLEVFHGVPHGVLAIPETERPGHFTLVDLRPAEGVFGGQGTVGFLTSQQISDFPNHAGISEVDMPVGAWDAVRERARQLWQSPPEYRVQATNCFWFVNQLVDYGLEHWNDPPQRR